MPFPQPEQLEPNNPAVQSLSEYVRSVIPPDRIYGPDSVETMSHATRRHTKEWQDEYRSGTLSSIYLETTAGQSRVEDAVRRFDMKGGVFKDGIGNTALMRILDDVIASGVWLPGREGAALVVKKFPGIVGIDSDNKPTSWVTVVIGSDGQLSTIIPSYRKGPNFRRIVENNPVPIPKIAISNERTHGVAHDTIGM